MKPRLFNVLAGWLMLHGKRYDEITFITYHKDFLCIHAIFMHDVNWHWEDLMILLGWGRITLFRNRIGKEKHERD